jgi:16S rRNA (adenine1518-N6/adenine1519-N6)-dimethyltransferase
MAFTVQKEASIRMAAKPGSKDYSAFSVLCTSACKVTPAFDLSASSFWPKPRVTSTLVVMKPKPKPVGGKDRKAFSTFCRAAFATRRKTLKNNLKAVGWPEGIIEPTLIGLGHKPSIRAEVLRPEDFEALLAALTAARLAAARLAAEGGASSEGGAISKGGAPSEAGLANPGPAGL